MKIIQLKNIVDGFATIDFSGVNMTEIMKSGDVSLLQGKDFKWNRTTGDIISDSPFYIGAMPIFATEKLQDVFSDCKVCSSTFKVEGKSYTIIAASQMDGNVINLEHSKCRTFRSGKIMTVDKFVFNSGIDYPDVFTPKEYAVFTFCKEEICKRLINCRFSQLLFVECLIE